ncbi:MAG: DedA family protein [Bdellovibrionales bacterium]|nr:DedA family protein [Bdellovibrionales bacterium]
MLRKFIDKILEYSKHKYAVPILCILSVVEASFFPIPPDLLLISMGLAKPKKAIHYAFLTTVFSVLGGLLGYMIGMYLWDEISPYFFRVVFSPDKFEKVKVLYENNAFFAIFISGYTPIPYKIFTITAGVFSIPLSVFIMASTMGRALRFFLFGTFIYFYGDHTRVWVQKHVQKVIVISSTLFLLIFILFKMYF